MIIEYNHQRTARLLGDFDGGESATAKGLEPEEVERRTSESRPHSTGILTGEKEKMVGKRTRWLGKGQDGWENDKMAGKRTK